MNDRERPGGPSERQLESALPSPLAHDVSGASTAENSLAQSDVPGTSEDSAEQRSSSQDRAGGYSSSNLISSASSTLDFTQFPPLFQPQEPAGHRLRPEQHAQLLQAVLSSTMTTPEATLAALSLLQQLAQPGPLSQNIGSLASASPSGSQPRPAANFASDMANLAPPMAFDLNLLLHPVQGQPVRAAWQPQGVALPLQVPPSAQAAQGTPTQMVLNPLTGGFPTFAMPSNLVPGQGQSQNVSLQLQTRPRRHYSHESFPSKLYRMLEETDRDGLAHIVSFNERGKSFKVHKPDEFSAQILPKYFRHNRLASLKHVSPQWRGASRSIFYARTHTLFPQVWLFEDHKWL